MPLAVNKSILPTVLALAFAAPLSGTALAATDLGTVTSLGTFGNTPALGLFDDLYNFGVSANSGAVISATTFHFGAGGATLTALQLYAGTFALAADLVGHTALPTTILYSQSAGTFFTAFTQMADYSTLGSINYTLRVAGSGSLTPLPYTGFISLAPVAPVPEPESYAMVLAGLGMMGAIVRRRRNR